MVLIWRLYATIEPRAWALLSIRQVRPDQTRTTWDPRAAIRSHEDGITFTPEIELNVREACFVIPSYERLPNICLYKVQPSHPQTLLYQADIGERSLDAAHHRLCRKYAVQHPNSKCLCQSVQAKSETDLTVRLLSSGSFSRTVSTWRTRAATRLFCLLWGLTSHASFGCATFHISR